MIPIAKSTASRCFHTLMCFLTFLIIALFLYAGVVITISFFSSKPKFEVSPVSSLSISNASKKDTTVAWDIAVSIRNPSKKLHVRYSSLNASIYYNNKSFTTIQVPPFGQETGNETVLKLRFREEMQGMDGMAEDLEHGSVTIKVVLLSPRLRLGPRAMWLVHYHLQVNCEDLEFKKSNDHSGNWKMDGGKDCDREASL